MTITAQTADGTLHQFPDGTSPDVIDRAMKAYTAGAAPQSQPNSFVDAARSIPGGLAQGVSALAGLPGDARDLIDRGVDYLADKVTPGFSAAAQKAPQGAAPKLPTSAQIADTVAQPFGGFYQPKTQAGKFTESIAAFAPAAFGGEASLATRALRAAIPGAASEGAGELTEGTAAEPYARVLTPLAMMLLGHGARPLARAANSATTSLLGKSFLDPNIEAATRLRGAFEGDGGAPEALNRASNFNNSGVNNFSLLDMGGPNVRQLVRGAADKSVGEGRRMAQGYADTTASALNDNVEGHANALTPGETRTAPQVETDLRDLQSRQATQDYAEPYSQPAVVTTDLVNALQGPEGRAAIGRAYVTARANRDVQRMGELRDLQDVATNQGATPDPVTGRFRTLSDALSELSSGSLDRVRIAMRDIGNSFISNPDPARRNPGMARGYLDRVRDIDTALDQTPGLTDARAAYRANQADIDAVQHGRENFFKDSGDFGSELDRLTGIQQRATPGAAPTAPLHAGVGVRNAINSAVESNKSGAVGVHNRLGSPRANRNLAATFGQDAADRFQQAVTNEVQRVRNAQFIAPESGSQTFGRLSGANAPDIPMSKYGLVRAFANYIAHGQGLTQAESDAIVRLGISPARLNAIYTAGRRQLSAPVRAAILANQSRAINRQGETP